ncbi:hypothetical protein DH2020_037702 [Rehmannia glutinosa]|uniref:SPT2 chromatin protein n=1 Tax=Rehmannia glutinosa TaxID=99300 RepID=A0ABR0V0M6_REHGL
MQRHRHVSEKNITKNRFGYPSYPQPQAHDSIDPCLFSVLRIALRGGFISHYLGKDFPKILINKPYFSDRVSPLRRPPSRSTIVFDRSRFCRSSFVDFEEYEDWDEYEEDGEEQEEEEGGEDGYEETQHQPTQEELEYLELRQKLKESIRKQMKKELGTANAGSRDKTNVFRKDNYGSFFGPSQPVIAQRVIQESKSLLENPDLAARISKPNRTNNTSSVSAPAKSKSRENYPPRVANGLKKKVEILKNTRDYSFLLSEDAEVPASLKSPPPRNVSGPKTGVQLLLYALWFFGGLEDARSAQIPPPRSKQVVNDRGREASNGRDIRKPMHASSQSRPKVGPERTAPAGKLSIESRRQLGSNNGSGPGRPLASKGVPSKSPVPNSGKANPAVAKNAMAGLHKPTPSTQQSVVRKPTPSHSQSGVHRPAPSRVQPSVLKKPPVQREYQETSKPKVMSKQALPSSRDQLKRPPPKPPARHSVADERPKPKPKRQLYDEDSDDDNAINMIRQMFRYNPNKFQDDDDVSDMEANFDDIMREEKRSAKIARKEDEEQLRLIEEEEKRERMRLAKKRKLGHK